MGLKGNFPAPGGPTCCALQRLFHVSLWRRILHAFIEGHDDVCSQIPLDFHGSLRTQKKPLPVLLVGKAYAFFGNLFLGEGKNLKPAGVGQNSLIPSHKPMQPAHALNSRQALAER